MQLQNIIEYLKQQEITPLPANWRFNIRAYFELLSEANHHFNLTKIRSFDTFLLKHILDSLLLVKVIPTLKTEAFTIADIGCGAGCPGLPLAISFPHLQLSEIDSSTKKINFVQSVIHSLQLSNCRAIHGKARELACQSKYQYGFDLVLARAVSNTARLIKECRLLLRKPLGSLVAYKTTNGITRERALTEREAKKHRLDLTISATYTLPEHQSKRQFFLISTKPNATSSQQE